MKWDRVHLILVWTQPPLTCERFQNVSNKVRNSSTQTVVPKEYEKINYYIMATVVEAHCSHQCTILLTTSSLLKSIYFQPNADLLLYWVFLCLM